MFALTAEAQSTRRVLFVRRGDTDRQNPLCWKDSGFARCHEAFWKIGISRFSKNKVSLCDLRGSNESSSFWDEWAVKCNLLKGVGEYGKSAYGEGESRVGGGCCLGEQKPEQIVLEFGNHSKTL